MQMFKSFALCNFSTIHLKTVNFVLKMLVIQRLNIRFPLDTKCKLNVRKTSEDVWVVWEGGGNFFL